jgi:hypothetical protein
MPINRLFASVSPNQSQTSNSGTKFQIIILLVRFSVEIDEGTVITAKLYKCIKNKYDNNRVGRS